MGATMETDAAVTRYLTPRDAAERLLISEGAVRNAISRGERRREGLPARQDR